MTVRFNDPSGIVVVRSMVRNVLFLATAVLAAACGGDSTGPPTPRVPNFIHLESDPGDWVGAGTSRYYTRADAIISVANNGGFLSLTIDGDESWTGYFVLPSTFSRVRAGSFMNLHGFPYHDPAAGGLEWSGDGRACSSVTGWFTIDSVTYTNDVLTAVDLRFQQTCGGSSSSLRGTIHWRSDDNTRPPGPVYPIPAGLWRPSPGSTPPSGSFIHLTSDPGDYTGQGQTYTYTPANASASFSANGGYLYIVLIGDEWWFGNFRTMNFVDRLETGYYPDVRRYPFHNPVKGGLDWSGHGRGCNRLVGWFIIDRATYAGDILTGLDLRFEQRCDGSSVALRGAIHWDG